MKGLYLLSSIILLSSFSPTIETIVTGHLKSKIGKCSIAHRLILVKYKGKNITSATTDNKGNFTLQFNMSMEDTTAIYFYYQHEQDTVFLKSITRFESDTPEITFYVP